ncbi:MAG: hypothetical protein QOF18_3133, partial [Frankiaceae bacterium]|nr:hypothetical protein [Frankiaceae bacterium]
MTAVGVVGGGAAGAMVVAHLARAWQGPAPLRVVLYDTSPRPARGLAYSTTEPHHLLNVPAGRMSALDGDVDHFLRWVQGRDASAGPEDFRSRAEYGDYLADTLADHARATGLTVRRSAVSDVTRVGDRLRVVHAAGFDVVDAVVLALGHAPPARLPFVVSPAASGYVEDPWSPGAMTDLEETTCPGDLVVTVGCGLTAVDVALSLTRRGRRVIAVSRNGLLPREHRPPLPEPLPMAVPAGDGPLTVARLEQLVTRHIETAVDGGLDWRSAVDGLRPDTDAMWRRLPLEERRLFLGAAGRRWEVLRHRMAPQVASKLQRLRHARAFSVLRAEVIAATGEERQWRVTIRRDGAVEQLGVSAVVNCTGPTCDIDRYPHDLGRRLVTSGLVIPDPLGLGVDTTGRGHVVDRMG